MIQAAPQAATQAAPTLPESTTGDRKKLFPQNVTTPEAKKIWAEAWAMVENVTSHGDWRLIHRALTEAYAASQIDYETAQKAGFYLIREMYPIGLERPLDGDGPLCQLAQAIVNDLLIQTGTTFTKDNPEEELTDDCKAPSETLHWITNTLGMVFVAGHRYAQLEARQKRIGELVAVLGPPIDTSGISTNAKIILLIADLGFPELKDAAQKVLDLCASSKVTSITQPNITTAYKELTEQTAATFLANRPDLYFQVFKNVHPKSIRTLKLRRR